MDSTLLNGPLTAVTDHVLNTIDKQYKQNPQNVELNDSELDEILNQIDDKEHELKKSDHNPYGTASSTEPRSVPNSDHNPHHVFTQRCNDILNDKERLKDVMEATFSWCGQKGLTYLEWDNGKYGHLPISLFPHLVSLSKWLDLRRCSAIFHKLADRMTRDSEFLLSRMKCIAEADPQYTAKFYQIYQKKITQNQFHSKYVFASLRMDYMRNGNRNQMWSQIESQFTPGGGMWVAKTNQLHEFILNRYVMERDVPIYDESSNAINLDKDRLFIPRNDTLQRFAGAVATAAKLVHRKNPIVLIIKDSSQQDCHLVAQELWDVHRIESIFRGYADIGRDGAIEETTKDLIMNGKYRISFVYCRGGSKRKEWKDKEGMDWVGRERIEFCTAIVDCNIAYTLINTKFMQTIYSEKDVLLQYLDEEEAEFLHKHFVANYNFDPRFKSKEEINTILHDAKSNCNEYVMKPSGDGGGHCVFGEDIVDLIERLCKKNNTEAIKLEGWILMEKIKNCVGKAIHVRDYKMENIDSVHEIGLYSHYLCDAASGDLVLINECICDLSKTRNVDHNEAGVSAGFGVIDTVVLDASR